MNIKVQSIHFDADKKLLQFIDERMGKLDKYFDNIISGEVFLKLEKSDVQENKVTEIKIQIPGVTLFAKEQCKSFEESTDLAIEALKKQVVKHKEKVRGI